MMKSVAVVVMMMMMMLSAAPLPPSLNNSSFFFIHSLEFHHLNMTFMSDFRVMLQSLGTRQQAAPPATRMEMGRNDRKWPIITGSS
ncbi:uncharacterized protein zgc:193726 isoform X10 [Hippoglossus stenolepis]|uniref:uncharacterized protein zgc:193726 isoform X10 n=1 Tax=Hippoglossus stenolepis TaxID=195615 RepID=UPI00159C3E12|nr:uncharacterized protein zgc:193726 isoform X10 [Hippoglossus stenolepis]